MRNELVVTFEGDHVRVISNGVKDHYFMERVFDEIAAVCEQHECYRVLGIAHSTVPPEVIDGYDTARRMRERNIDHRYRIAWVEHNEDAIDVIEFVETVLANRGLPGRLFPDEATAKEWLFEDLQKP
jgi:hypothetical protein